jgi:hypothetical protein
VAAKVLLIAYLSCIDPVQPSGMSLAAGLLSNLSGPTLRNYGEGLVNMDVSQGLLFAALTGMSVAFASGYLGQWITGAEACFAAPFVNRDHLLRSLAVTAVSGPFLLIGELARARAHGAVPKTVSAVAIAFAGLWMVALGIVTLSASQMFAAALAIITSDPHTIGF